MYERGCGFENVLMAWGHDEYLYRVLAAHEQCVLPREALYVIRFHSFYPHHQHGAYNHLCSEFDSQMLPYLQDFQKLDLYSKTDELPDIEKLAPYYDGLIQQFCPGQLCW